MGLPASVSFNWCIVGRPPTAPAAMNSKVSALAVPVKLVGWSSHASVASAAKALPAASVIPEPAAVSVRT